MFRVQGLTLKALQAPTGFRSPLKNLTTASDTAVSTRPLHHYSNRPTKHYPIVESRVATLGILLGSFFGLPAA